MRLNERYFGKRVRVLCFLLSPDSLEWILAQIYMNDLWHNSWESRDKNEEEKSRCMWISEHCFWKRWTNNFVLNMRNLIQTNHKKYFVRVELEKKKNELALLPYHYNHQPYWKNTVVLLLLKFKHSFIIKKWLLSKSKTYVWFCKTCKKSAVI